MSYGGRLPPYTPDFDRSATVVDQSIAGIDGCASRADHVTPPDMEMTNCCRSLLMSRLRAVEILNKQLSVDARSSNRLLSLHPPGKYNVDLAIEQIRAQLLSLFEVDIGLIRQLLNVSEQIEEMKWQRKFQEGSSCTPSTIISSSCTADVESVDLEDPYLDYISSTHPLPSSALRDCIRPLGDYTDNDVTRQYDDVTDDVFQNDDTAHGPTRINNALRSNELRFNVIADGVRACGPDGVKKSNIQLKVDDQKAVDVSKSIMVELHVNSPQNAKKTPVSSRPDSKVGGSYNINVKDRCETAKVEFLVDNTKDTVSKMVSSPAGVRLILHPHNSKGNSALSETPLQTEASGFTQRGPESVPDDLNMSKNIERKQLNMGKQGQIHAQNQSADTKRSVRPPVKPKTKPRQNIVTHL